MTSEPRVVDAALAASHTSPYTGADRPDLRPLLLFAAVALPAGWVLLTVPLLLGLPVEAFVLATLLFGMVVPALVITARESGRSAVWALLRDAVRLPRPLWWGPLSVLALPAIVWSVAAALGGAVPVTAAVVSSVAIELVSAALIINIWEEVALTGFFQRRAISRWGVVRGSSVTAMLFAGIHVPLAFGGADTVQDVLLGVAALVATAVGIRFLIAGVDAWSGRSLLTIGLLHASFNAAYSLIDPAYDWVRLTITVAIGGAVLVGLRRSDTRGVR